jgi:peptidoglycan/LPS O-acetylase OafA/YrhL
VGIEAEVTKSPTREYIPHIDGLRTLAVLSVFFFHLDIPYIEGGYLGVDVFL